MRYPPPPARLWALIHLRDWTQSLWILKGVAILTPLSPARLFRTFPEVDPRRGCYELEGGIYTERSPMVMRGGSLFSHFRSQTPPAPPGQFPVGGWEEFQPCLRNGRWREGTRVRIFVYHLFGEHCVPRLCAVRRRQHSGAAAVRRARVHASS